MKVKILSIFLSLCLCLSVLAACQREEKEEETRPARYGEYGANFAIEFCRQVPTRAPGSPGEAQAAQLIKAQLTELGYSFESQPFAFNDRGQQLKSENIIVKITGRGFALDSDYKPEETVLDGQTPPSILEGRRLYILAHYDTAAVEDPALALEERTGIPAFQQADGLHDNAAAVAVLMTLAKEAKKLTPGYDLYLVFSGAAHADFAGARALLSSLNENDKSLTDCVINLAAVYAGDKIYAHAGQNSVTGENSKDYSLRRKLYEVTDIYYNNLLLTHNNFAIYTNQSLVRVTHPVLGYPVSYREWTLYESDHSPFDRAGWPIVFIQSGQYDFDSEQQTFRESTDPFFNASGGRISGTGFDASGILLPHFAAELSAARADDEEESEIAIDRLNRNINNLAFVLLELSRKAPPHTEIK